MKQPRPNPTPEATVRAIYRTLARSWGPQHWWPAETAFEVMVGAILTQNTSWTNVERALAKLRSAGALNLASILGMPLAELERLIRSSGYYRQKAKRLKQLVHFLDQHYGGSVARMFSEPTRHLRNQLLSLHGVGPETADSILLYAANHEVFVVDAYTRRILERHAAIKGNAKYEDVRQLVERALRQTKPIFQKPLAADTPAIHPPSPISSAARSDLAQRYNETHGLFVQLGKHFCTKTLPKCHACPLKHLLPSDGQELLSNP